MNRKDWVLHVLISILVCKGYCSSRVTHNVATDMCKTRGLLAPHSNFQTIPGTVNVRQDAALKATYGDVDIELDDGESAWVSGYAHMSKNYLAWYGCKSIREDSENLTAKHIERNSLNHCLHACSTELLTRVTHGLGYLGLGQHTCFCITNHQLSRLVDDKDCDIHGNWTTSIAVYEFWLESVHKIGLTHPYQCISAERDGHTYKYVSENCLNKHEAICIDYNSNQKINGTCPAINRYYITKRAEIVCKVTDGKSWIDVLRTCQDVSGKIMPYMYGYAKEQFSAKIYWVGLFRSFNVIERGNGSGHELCLAVTRDGQQLFLQPNYCNDELKYICRGDDQHIGKAVSNNSPRSMTVIVIATVALFVFVSVVALAVFIRKWKSNNTRRISRLFNNESEYDHAETSIQCSAKYTPQSPTQTKETEPDVSTLENMIPNIPDSPQVTDQKTKVRPEKPMRNTLRRQKEKLLQDTTHENFTLKKTKVVGEGDIQPCGKTCPLSDDYDKIDLAKPKQPFPTENADIHVYDHAIIDTQNEYDTMRSVKSIERHIASDETYSKTNFESTTTCNRLDSTHKSESVLSANERSEESLVTEATMITESESDQIDTMDDHSQNLIDFNETTVGSQE